MSRSLTFLLNKFMLLSGKWEHYRYHSHAAAVGDIQRKKLFKYLSQNHATIYGKQYGFGSIQTYEAFAGIVPIIEHWDQYENYIGRMENGEKNVLFRGSPLAFEETSGSTGFSKLIPYNTALRAEFQKAVQVWMLDLFAASRRAFYGKAYWSVSPALKEKRRNNAGIPIGLTDSEYFSPFVARLLSHTIVLPTGITEIKDPRTFYLATLKQLLLEEDLSFISVWSPSFFMQLDGFLKGNWDELLSIVKGISLKRYSELAGAQKGGTWKTIWPKLVCISCWADAQAAAWIPQLKKIAGDVFIQPKGLLATEAVISIPIKNQPFPALAYRSHFFEFRSISDQSVHLAHRLQAGKYYEVIVTTAGGLYRYATKDVIQVCGFYRQVPLLKFMGRSNRTSDMVGEKVSEVQVNEIISTVFGGCSNGTHIFIKPERVEQCGFYVLYIESGSFPDKAAELLIRVEAMLCQNPYYKQAIATGQLKALQIKVLPAGFSEKLAAFYRQQKGIKDGNIKLPVLFLENELALLKDWL